MQRIEPGPVRFVGTVPGDKSITHRAILLALVSRGRTEIRGALESEDTAATVRFAEALGARVTRRDEALLIDGPVEGPRRAAVDCANSGTTARLGLGLAAGLAGSGVAVRLTGDASLSRRPMARVADPLREAGVDVAVEDGHLPAEVRGGAFRGGTFTLPVASAQVKSALLLAGLAAGVAVSVTEPYRSRDHTERMLRLLGVALEEEDGDRGHTVRLPASARPTAGTFTVPGDPSSAAFFLALGALPGNSAEVRNVSLNPTRTGILSVLRAMGAEVVTRERGEASGDPVGDVRVTGTRLRPFAIDGSLVPAVIDEIPVLATLALFAEGESVVRGAAELRVKETDRIEVLAEELRKAGADIVTLPDGMIVRGGRTLSAAAFDAHGDHRLAMALAVLATRLPGPSTVHGDEAVAVSFPGFWSDLARAQAEARGDP
jgi:3-phosphoshikimate 1-carboxyvinyltransferase